MKSSIKQIGPIRQIETTLKHAREIHMAILGDKKAWEVVTVQEAEGLQLRRCFPLFLEVNRDRLAIVETGVR